MKKLLAKNMYIKENKSIEDICIALGVSRATFYYYKNKDQKDFNISWDELKLINAYDKKPTIENEKIFLSTLILEFEKTLQQFKDENAEDKLKKLEQFARTYYKLKIPQGKTALKFNKVDILKEFLTKLIDIALKQNHKEVANFLSANSNFIVDELLKNE